MPRAKSNASSSPKSVEPEKKTEAEKPVDSDEKVDLDEEDPEDAMDEEIEYEEVEEDEEIEEELEEEEVEESEDEDVEEVENKDANENGTHTVDGKAEDEDEKKKQADLLTLPPHGSEVYVGGIAQGASEEDLRSLCDSIGEVFEVRIIKSKDSNESKGFAFVTFKNVELATKAIDELNNVEFKGKRIKCSTSQAKHRLFIGNIPRAWGEDDLRKVVTEIGPGVMAVELVKDVKNTSNNRGFAFLDYYNHACAEYSRQKMMNPKFKLDDNVPTVSWADPKNADSSAASQVKAVYVKKLPKNVTQEKLKQLFEHHGKIVKVVLPPAKSGQEKNRIGFVHFAERSSAMKALKNTEIYELDGQILECSLAKPQADQKSSGSNAQSMGLLPNYPPAGYGFIGGGYGASAVSSGYAGAGFAQPLNYGRGLPPAGMAMMPMLLPDGRIGYVLQQPGRQPHAHAPQPRNNMRNNGGGGSENSGGSSSRGRPSNESGGRGGRYRPY